MYSRKLQNTESKLRKLHLYMSSNINTTYKVLDYKRNKIPLYFLSLPPYKPSKP